MNRVGHRNGFASNPVPEGNPQKFVPSGKLFRQAGHKAGHKSGPLSKRKTEHIKASDRFLQLEAPVSVLFRNDLGDHLKSIVGRYSFPVAELLPGDEACASSC